MATLDPWKTIHQDIQAMEEKLSAANNVIENYEIPETSKLDTEHIEILKVMQKALKELSDTLDAYKYIEGTTDSVESFKKKLSKKGVKNQPSELIGKMTDLLNRHDQLGFVDGLCTDEINTETQELINQKKNEIAQFMDKVRIDEFCEEDGEKSE